MPSAVAVDRQTGCLFYIYVGLNSRVIKANTLEALGFHKATATGFRMCCWRPELQLSTTHSEHTGDPTRSHAVGAPSRESRMWIWLTGFHSAHSSGPQSCSAAGSPAHSPLTHYPLLPRKSVLHHTTALFMSFHPGVVLPLHGRHPKRKSSSFQSTNNNKSSKEVGRLPGPSNHGLTMRNVLHFLGNLS